MKYIYRIFPFVLILLISNQSFAQSTLDCSQCHTAEYSNWLLSRHANTQNDVSDELASEWKGFPPDSIIFGQNAEDCIACHSATSITVNGGMSEVLAMGYFFSTTNGIYTDSTTSLHADQWPHNACVTCHNVSDNHPVSVPELAIFNSPSASYNPITNVSELCGQCHGSVRFANTDHRIMDAWKLSKHGRLGQIDVGSEIGGDFAGKTPEEVTNEENCIACHASTSVLLNGGISEAEALGLFFTTTNGVFTDSTTLQNSDLWPEVGCTSCHNQHNPELLSYFNSSTKEFEIMPSSQILCGQCHGNLRFPDTDHLSYNIEQGTGGLGVPDKTTMPDVNCVDCHMHVGDVDGSNAAMFGGHLWSTFIQEDNGTESASCTNCHSSINANTSHLIIEGWKTEYEDLALIANSEIIAAESFLIGSSDSSLIHMLEEAQFNLAFAEGDESRGVHNHIYTISLLNDAIDKARLITTGLNNNSDLILHEFMLYQNYPNPFNPSTQINYSIANTSNVSLVVYDGLGKEVRTLFNDEQQAGNYQLIFNGENLSSGIYFATLKSEGYSKTIKMLLIK